ncbi:hypothetical protein DFJ58DRAFT_666932 [Suillus subalutaceus]|uniref:uncharacterized protein n=1 Tax=Suillus subalutaceus TaxID=48586 RepID=UPI001B865E89|nr:uncharacterized protein DFJ58DRAFT_666932 [Suillus subalutaceus]KAG1840722.1 hypothetical protein DFJ58DRAFT_666932 [Suillus subalutaceus]
MSSCGNPAAEEQALMPRRLKFGKSKDCVRCRLKPGNIMIRHAAYCKECFTPIVDMKFRKALEPSVNARAGTSKRPKLKASGNLCLGFSGGLGSSIMLDIVHNTYFSSRPPLDDSGKPRGGTNHPRNASVWPSCIVCYVEVCGAFAGMQDRTEDIRSVVERYQSFEFVPLRIEDAFDESWWTKVSGSNNTPQVWLELSKEGLITDGLHVASQVTDLTPVEAMRSYLSSLPTQTAISSALQNLTRVLILHTAHSRGSSHLLFGSSLTSLSISLLSSISQGGGYAIREELQEEWASAATSGSKPSDVLRVIRPLRDVTAKECAVYAWWNNISVVGRDKQRRAILGIAALTKNFIVGLEKDYPSTVSTIARTCEKLEPKDTPSGQCRLCKRPMQSAIQEWKSRISIRSYSDDKIAADLAHIPSPCRGNLDTSTPSQVPPLLALTDFLCYSCHTTLTSRSSRGVKQSAPAVSSATPLPIWVADRGLHEDGLMGDEARRKIPEEEMLDTVAKFLIDNQDCEE